LREEIRLILLQLKHFFRRELAIFDAIATKLSSQRSILGPEVMHNALALVHTDHRAILYIHCLGSVLQGIHRLLCKCPGWGDTCDHQAESISTEGLL
jgi:hypothetical protein